MKGDFHKRLGQFLIPALTGQALKEQISSFLGDCDKGFLGNGFLLIGIDELNIYPY